MSNNWNWHRYAYGTIACLLCQLFMRWMGENRSALIVLIGIMGYMVGASVYEMIQIEDKSNE